MGADWAHEGRVPGKRVAPFTCEGWLESAGSAAREDDGAAAAAGNGGGVFPMFRAGLPPVSACGEEDRPKRRADRDKRHDERGDLHPTGSIAPPSAKALRRPRERYGSPVRGEECGVESDDGQGWRALIGEEDDDSLMVAVFCPACVAREFGERFTQPA